MKTRLQKLILSLLIAVLCVNCALPAFAAAEMTDKQKQFLEKGMEDSRKTFLDLYAKLWQEHKLDRKLSDVIDSAVEERLSSLPWGTRRVQTLLRSSIGDDVQNMVVERFNPYYEKFIRDLERRFADENNEHVALFYKNISDAAISEYDNPAVRVYISRSTKQITEGSAKTLQKLIAKSITQEKRKGGFLMAGTITVGFATKLFSQTVSKFIINKLGLETIAKGAGAKIAEFGIPFVGYALATWEAVKLLKTVLNAPKELREKLYTGMSVGCKTEQPDAYWENMKNDVRVIYEEAYATFNRRLEDAKELANDPKVKAAMEND